MRTAVNRHSSQQFNAQTVADTINAHIGHKVVNAPQILHMSEMNQTLRLRSDNGYSSIVFHSQHDYNGKPFIKLTLYTYSVKGVKRTPSSITYTQ